MIYTSTSNEKIKALSRLNEKKYRDQEDLFLIEGEHVVLEAYKKGLIKELIVDENEGFKLDVPTIHVTSKVIKYLSNLTTPPKIMAVCKKINSNTIGRKILILDDIQDPGNLGAIIRSAVAFNVDTIVLSVNSVDLYNSKVIRSTQGLLFYLNYIRCDIIDFINKIKHDNYTIYGTKVDGGKILKNVDTKKEKFAIIMGNEGNGLNKNIYPLCDDFIYIEMNNVCESLNVAVATSIILYEFLGR